MRVTLSEPVKGPDYPRLVVLRDMADPFVLLLTSNSRGVVLTKGSSLYEPGSYSHAWDEELFEPYGGAVTLQN